MKRFCIVQAVLVCLIGLAPARAHDLHDPNHPHYDKSVRPPALPRVSIAQRLAQLPAKSSANGVQLKNAPWLSSIFSPFHDTVHTHWDEQFLFVESNGMPDHRMMTGITAWQQQVPLPQNYTGNNAWRLPLKPIEARTPLSAKDHFFRGAIALAANGVPIFNPIKNDGRTDTFLAGELDEYGGHAGRADDYHYHIAPLHLQAQVGAGKAVAVALDGYPIYGLTDPDGTTPKNLDAFNGHSTPALGYHYHASKSYPYLNGGFHGEVTERDGQVDPQPRAFGVRPALPPLPGAKITGFTSSADGKSFDVQYEQDGKTGHVRYFLEADGTYRFQYVNSDGTSQNETYRREKPREPRDNPPPREDKPRDEKPRNDGPRPDAPRGGPNPNDPNRKPWIVDHLQEMDADHDGTLTRAEMEVEIKNTFSGYDRDKDGKISEAERDTRGGVRSAMGGFVKGHWHEVDANGDNQIAPDELSALGLNMFAKSDRNGDNRVTPDELNAPAGSEDGKPNSFRGPNPFAGARPNNRSNNSGAPDNLSKATMADTITANIYADNWFALYINGTLRVVDPIEFLPHNVVSVDILPQYPMTIAVIAHDNADPKTGLEYGDHIGDGGLVLKFADGTVTDASWKVKVIERGPLSSDIKNPRVQSETAPKDWFLPDFNDSKWDNARVFTEQEVNPKAPFYEHDFKGAQFIWSSDLGLDNTVLFRKRIEKPTWKPNWNAQPAGPLPQGF